MSDYIVKIIPKDPFYKVSDVTLRLAKSFLQMRVRCDFIEVGVSETPVFVALLYSLKHSSVIQSGGERLWIKLLNADLHHLKQKCPVVKD